MLLLCFCMVCFRGSILAITPQRLAFVSEGNLCSISLVGSLSGGFPLLPLLWLIHLLPLLLWLALRHRRLHLASSLFDDLTMPPYSPPGTTPLPKRPLRRETYTSLVRNQNGWLWLVLLFLSFLLLRSSSLFFLKRYRSG